MAELNTWWTADSAERYWLEITDRADLGTDLFAPQQDDAGHPYWSYNLVTHVRADDVVLHWHKTLLGAPAIAGRSVATGRSRVSTITWQARGTVGRRSGPQPAEPAWLMPLTDYTPLLKPVTQTELREAEPTLRRVYNELRDQHSGPLYFPFAFSDKRPVRTAQGYLVKFPAALLDVFEGELKEVPKPNGLRASTPAPAPDTEPAKATDGVRYMNDARVRKAVERHAVLRASAYYAELGYDVEDVGNLRPYDLHTTSTSEKRRIEVKGSTGTIAAVELTTAEVDNARDHALTDLFVVDQIDWWREPDGSVSTAGGRERVFHDWTPATSDLNPTRFRYQLPGT